MRTNVTEKTYYMDNNPRVLRLLPREPKYLPHETGPFTEGVDFTIERRNRPHGDVYVVLYTNSLTGQRQRLGFPEPSYEDAFDWAQAALNRELIGHGRRAPSRDAV